MSLTDFIIGEYVADEKCIMKEFPDFSKGILSQCAKQKENKKKLAKYLFCSVYFNYHLLSKRILNNITCFNNSSESLKVLFYLFKFYHSRFDITNNALRLSKIAIKYLQNDKEYEKLLQIIHSKPITISKAFYYNIFKYWLYCCDNYGLILQECVRYYPKYTPIIFETLLADPSLCIYDRKDIVFASVRYGFTEYTKKCLDKWNISFELSCS